MPASPYLPLIDSRTKTVATVGPASCDPEILAQLLLSGVDVFRINMAHGDRASHAAAVAAIRQAGEATHLPAGILVDLAGPKIRLGTLATSPIHLANGQTVRFVRGLNAGGIDELTCTYEPLIDEVAVDDEVVLADGTCRLKVTEKHADELVCTVIDGGPIRSRQGVNLPGTQLSVPALGDVDLDNAIWAAGQGIDFISLSFVRNADEVRQLKKLLADQNSQAMVISKIEKREALDHLDSIVEATDGVMVARGDLGVEVPIEKTPGIQKRIIKTCLKFRKPVIVATQMLESMHSSKQPTRAEVTDVANAILDGADACMLSGETAIGMYPIESVSMMNRIMSETELSLAQMQPMVTAYPTSSGWDIPDAVVFGSAEIASRIDAKMVVLASRDSKTALLKSKQRDYVPTICVTDNETVYRRMSLFWGVIPVFCHQSLSQVQLREFVNQWIKQNAHLTTGDRFLIVTDTELLPGIHDSVLVSEVV